MCAMGPCFAISAVPDAQPQLTPADAADQDEAVIYVGPDFHGEHSHDRWDKVRFDVAIR